MAQPYTLAQKAKAVVAAVGAACTLIVSMAAYVAASELVSDEVKGYAALAGGVAGIVGTYIATFRRENATTRNGWIPAEIPDSEGQSVVEDPDLEGTH